MSPSAPTESSLQPDRVDPAAEGGVAALARGILIIRWAVLAWMIVLVAERAATGTPGGVVLAGTATVAAVVWTVVLTVTGPPRRTVTLVTDLLVAAALMVVGAHQPWFATVYPVIAALAWGAARGVVGGVTAAVVLGLVSVVADLTVGGPLQLVPTLRDPVNLLLAGGGLGFVATLLERSAAQVRAAMDEQVAATERAARATERESIGRQLHDSVLQSLAMVHKRGRELAEYAQVEGAQVARLADLAGAQERALRAMILRPPDDEPADEAHVPLRERLTAAALTAGGDVDVTVVGDPRLPRHHVEELGAAVEQALHNIGQHAAARHAWVFAEISDGCAIVSVRDDGRGFRFDPDALRSAGKIGLLRSIGGRAADLGGTLHVDSAPGRGTELELRVPVPPDNLASSARSDHEGPS